MKRRTEASHPAALVLLAAQADALDATAAARELATDYVIAENRERKDFTPSEAVAVGMALEERERKEARERQAASRFGIDAGADNLSAPQEPGRTREIIGRAVGMSGSTYEAAKS